MWKSEKKKSQGHCVVGVVCLNCVNLRPARNAALRVESDLYLLFVIFTAPILLVNEKKSISTLSLQ